MTRGIGQRDRTAIEMKVLIEALTYSGCYDQFNLPALLSVVILGRRASQIIEAYDPDLARPDWSGIRFLLGESHSLNPVPRQARA